LYEEKSGNPGGHTARCREASKQAGVIVPKFLGKGKKSLLPPFPMASTDAEDS
jgi:hypothetical protein